MLTSHPGQHTVPEALRDARSFRHSAFTGSRVSNVTAVLRRLLDTTRVDVIFSLV